MKVVEVILGPGKRKVYRADGFYLEQVDPGSPDGRRGSTSQLVICRLEYDDTSNSADVKTTVIDRIPRWSWIHKHELPDGDTAPARVHEETGWALPAVKIEPEPEAALPASELTRDGLPKAPKAAAAAKA